MSCCRARCFHCNAPLPEGTDYRATLDGEPVSVCSTRCKSAVETITDAGLNSFYRYRTEPAPSSDSHHDDESDQWRAFDRAETQQGLVTTSSDGSSEIIIWIEGIRCGACTWLLEQTLSKLDGVISTDVDLGTARARVRWRPARIPLSRILETVDKLGYRPHPVRPAELNVSYQHEKRLAMKRLAVAGLGMMQVVSYAAALYVGAFQGIDPTIEAFLRLVSMLVATPVLFYAGYPFFASAWRDLRNKQLGMDVPVSLALGSAYVASLWNTLEGAGEIYFDSVTMFVFLLSLGRYLEMLARHRAGSAADAVSRLLPDTAVRLEGGSQRCVGIRELRVGERVLVRPGDIFPADGYIVWGGSHVNESLLTGESEPLDKNIGDHVLAGSINLTGPLHVELRKVAEEAVLSEISRLLQKAQSHRPHLAGLADRIAGRFIGAVLLLAVGTAIYWWHENPALAFPITLSVLVITCPCALSLATPTALIAATGFLARNGILITRASALETLARVDRAIFDKTGTLTQGKIALKAVTPLHGSTNDALRIAAALENSSEHPIASAFESVSTGITVSELSNVPGEGIQGRADGKLYRIGNREFVDALRAGSRADLTDKIAHSDRSIFLGDDQHLIARFELSDELRPEALEITRALAQTGLALEIASGDRAETVGHIARQAGIDRYHGRLKPEDKLALIRRHQAEGETVMAVGDGVNDAPVLAGANVSAAVASGSPLAQVSADMIVLGDSLRPLLTAVSTASRTSTVIRQNLIWALCYNGIALPLAATGWIQPWMAVMGMSASSLLVVLNALRLTRAPRIGRPVPRSEALAPALKGMPG